MERPRAEPARQDGRHPARTRRKRKLRRALRPKNVWQTETHWSPFNPAVMLGSSALFAGAIFVSALLPALKEAPSWLMTTVMLSLLAAILTTPFYTATFLHWRVAEQLILALQPGRGATMTRSFDNRDFKALSTCGPFAIIRCTSGKRLVWPRWLVYKWVVYRWHLDGDKLSLRASGLAQSGTNTSQGNVA
jgi:hypothetical protein